MPDNLANSPDYMPVVFTGTGKPIWTSPGSQDTVIGGGDPREFDNQDVDVVYTSKGKPVNVGG